MPFVNGQWTDRGDFDFAGRFEEGYDNRMKRGATQDARDAYAAGDADRAASLVMPYDPQAASGYRDEGTRAYQRRYADAYGSQDFDRAQTEARARGDLTGLEAARTEQNNSRFRGQVAEANRYRADLRRIHALADPKQKNAAYEQFLAQAAEETKASGQDPRFLSQIKETFPEWNEQAFTALDGMLLQAARAYATDDPESYIQGWVKEQELAAAQAKADRDERRLELEGRRVVATEAKTDAQIAALSRSGSGQGKPPSGYTWGPDGGLVPIPGGPADSTTRLAGGDAIRASNALSSVKQIGDSLHSFRQLLQSADKPALMGLGANGAALASAHRALALRMKGPAAFDLGALVGADFNILNDTIGEPGNIRQLLLQGGKEGMLARLDQVETFLRSSGQQLRQTYSPYAQHPALQQYYQDGGGPPADLPPAAANANKQARDPATGELWRSDGQTWTRAQ